MGKTPYYIVRHHILPLIASQIFIGFILLFPHVILHEASMTFLGFGLSAEQPSVGIICQRQLSISLLEIGGWLSFQDFILFWLSMHLILSENL